jgi:hypothetical protein
MVRVVFLFLSIFLSLHTCFGQNVGVVRKNFFSTYFDPTLNQTIDVFDSSTIRLGTVDPLTGVVSNLSSNAYNLAINLNGATIDCYQNHYYIGSGFNLLTFDMNSGDLINNVPVSGALPTASFQNYRFNPSDSIIYGLVPSNFYSSYFDSLTMSTIEVLDSSQIRFGSIDPVNGQYTLIGDYSFNNLYTLAGNSIDPYQMIYYYSAVDTLIGIDLYDGSLYTEIPIQMQPFGIFENIAYSCADTSIYGLSRQNFTSSVFDSLIMEYVEVVDSITFRLTKIDPNTGVVTFISPYNIQVSGNLTGGSYIDPNSMTYYFKNGNNIVGISLITGLITSSVLKTFPSGEVSIDMMRSSLNCYGATKIRPNPLLGVVNEPKHNLTMSPNPAQTEITFHATMSIEMITVIDFLGNYLLTSANNSIDVSNLPEGIYFAKVHMQDGVISTQKFIKN